MNCDTCQDRLLDLLYEEIDGAQADEARAHVEGCDPCRESFEKLGFAQRMAAALPEEEPDRTLDAAILAAARQKVGAEPERAQPERVRDLDEDDGPWASILRWLTGFAASPQFVMATIMMLVVAIGLWYLPTGRRQPEAGGETVASLDHEGEAAPSATLEPAEPLELDIDERTGRLRRRGGGEPADRPAAGDVSLAQRARADGDDDAVAQAAEQAMEMPAETARSEAVAERTVRNRAEEAGEVVADSLADDEARTVAGNTARGGEAPAREQQQRRATRAPGALWSLDSAGAGSGSAGSAGRAEAGYAPSAPSAPSASAAAPEAEESGADMGPTGAEETMPTALHMQARRFAQNDSCEQAVSKYRELLRRYSGYSRTPLAMVEMADCLRQLGRLSEAHTMYRRAERYRSVATRARRGRYHVEQLQRSRRMMDEAAAAPAEAY